MRQQHPFLRDAIERRRLDDLVAERPRVGLTPVVGDAEKNVRPLHLVGFREPHESGEHSQHRKHNHAIGHDHLLEDTIITAISQFERRSLPRRN